MTNEDEYELFFNHINSLMERRKSVTATYLSVNAAITGALAFLFKDGQLQDWTQQISVLVLLAAGIAACILWRMLIHHYSTTIGWWYRQLRHLESVMSGSSKMITEEYAQLNKGSLPTRVSTYEVRLVWLFAVVYSLFIVGILYALISRLG
jgi:hypothetical protein